MSGSSSDHGWVVITAPLRYTTGSDQVIERLGIGRLVCHGLRHGVDRIRPPNREIPKGLAEVRVIGYETDVKRR